MEGKRSKYYQPPKDVNRRGAWSPEFTLMIPKGADAQLNAFRHIQLWCQKHNHNINGFFTSLFVPVAYHCLNFTTKDATGRPVVNLNLGTIPIISRLGPFRGESVAHNLQKRKFTMSARGEDGQRAYYQLRQWCSDMDMNFCDWFHTLMQPLAYCAVNFTTAVDDCNVAIIFKMGDVTFIRSTNHPVNRNFTLNISC